MRIAIGLSGGVDSCVAAWLLKEAGHEVVGVTMDLNLDGILPKELPGSACFGPASAKSVADAAAFAERIGIRYRSLPCGAEYRRVILEYFRKTYMEGRTPNPCVLCNAEMKFGLLPRLVRESGIEFDRFATGHYARIDPSHRTSIPATAAISLTRRQRKAMSYPRMGGFLGGTTAFGITRSVRGRDLESQAANRCMS